MFLSCKNYAMAIGLFCLSASGLVATSAGADAEKPSFVTLRIDNQQHRDVIFTGIVGANFTGDEAYPLGDAVVTPGNYLKISLPTEYAWGLKFQVSGFKKPSGKVVSATRALPVSRKFDPFLIKSIVITVKPHEKGQESIEITTDLRPSVGQGSRGRSGTVASEKEMFAALTAMALADIAEEEGDIDGEHALAGAGAAGAGGSVGAAENNWQRLVRLYLARYQMATRSNWQRFVVEIMKQSNRRAVRSAQQEEDSEDAEFEVLFAEMPTEDALESETAMATATGGLGATAPTDAPSSLSVGMPASDLPGAMEEERREPQAGAPLPAGAGTGAGGEAARDPLQDITNAVATLSLGEGVGVGAAALPAGSESWGAWLARMARLGY
jgi:hypothetical protein